MRLPTSAPLSLLLFILTSSALRAEPQPPIAPIAQPHGVEQVHRLLGDRFNMAAYRTTDGVLHKVAETDVIFTWLSREFAGEAGQEIVFWNPEPAAKALGDHDNPSRLIPGYIQIATYDQAVKDNPRFLMFEELWRIAAYELISLRRTEEWNPTQAKVWEGKLTKEEYIEAGARFEYESHERLVEFYEKVWRPWAKSVGFQPNEELWKLPAPTFAEWRAAYTDHAGYPWSPFGEMFDWVKIYGKDTALSSDPKSPAATPPPPPPPATESPRK